MSLAIGMVKQDLVQAQSRAIASSLGLKTMRYLSPPNSLFLQGLQSYQQDQLAVSASIFQRTLERFRQLDDSHGEAKTLYYLGLNHEALNQIAPALDYYKQFLAVAEALRDGPGLVFEYRARVDQVTEKINLLQRSSKTA